MVGWVLFIKFGKVKGVFHFIIRVKVRQLKNKLINTRREDSIAEYLLEIKKTVDTLALIGAPIDDLDHVDAILYGLIEEYESFTSQVEPCEVGELEALLMAQERIERYQKNKVQPFCSATTTKKVP